MKSVSFRAAKKAAALDLFIYDVIGDSWYGITAQMVQQAIKDAGDFTSITMHINSPGGDCFEGTAIYNIVRQQKVPVTVIVEGLAASAAFTIAMAGDTIKVGDGTMMMLHNAWTYAIGYACDLRQTADLLDKVSDNMAEIYSKRSSLSIGDVQALMDAETYLSPDEAIAKGFATEKLDGSAEETDAAAASATKTFDLAAFEPRKFAARVPELLKAALAKKKTAKADSECACTCDPCKKGNCEECSHDPCSCENCTCPGHKDQNAKASVPVDVLLRELELAGA